MAKLPSRTRRGQAERHAERSGVLLAHALGTQECAVRVHPALLHQTLDARHRKWLANAFIADVERTRDPVVAIRAALTRARRRASIRARGLLILFLLAPDQAREEQ